MGAAAAQAANTGVVPRNATAEGRAGSGRSSGRQAPDRIRLTARAGIPVVGWRADSGLPLKAAVVEPPFRAPPVAAVNRAVYPIQLCRNCAKTLSV
jgi:hypothetical protein